MKTLVLKVFCVLLLCPLLASSKEFDDEVREGEEDKVPSKKNFDVHQTLNSLITEGSDKRIHYLLTKVALGTTNSEFLLFFRTLVTEIEKGPEAGEDGQLLFARKIWSLGRLLIYCKNRPDLDHVNGRVREIIPQLLLILSSDLKLLFIEPHEEGLETRMKKAKMLVKYQVAQTLSELALVNPKFFIWNKKTIEGLIEQYSDSTGTYKNLKQSIASALASIKIFSFDQEDAIEFYREMVRPADGKNQKQNILAWVHALITQTMAEKCLGKEVPLNLKQAALHFNSVAPDLSSHRIHVQRNQSAPITSFQVIDANNTTGADSVLGGFLFLLKKGDMMNLIFRSEAEFKKFFQDMRGEFIPTYGLPDEVRGIDFFEALRFWEFRMEKLNRR